MQLLTKQKTRLDSMNNDLEQYAADDLMQLGAAALYCGPDVGLGMGGPNMRGSIGTRSNPFYTQIEKLPFNYNNITKRLAKFILANEEVLSYSGRDGTTVFYNINRRNNEFEIPMNNLRYSVDITAENFPEDSNASHGVFINSNLFKIKSIENNGPGTLEVKLLEEIDMEKMPENLIKYTIANLEKTDTLVKLVNIPKNPYESIFLSTQVTVKKDTQVENLWKNITDVFTEHIKNLGFEIYNQEL